MSDTQAGRESYGFDPRVGVLDPWVAVVDPWVGVVDPRVGVVDPRVEKLDPWGEEHDPRVENPMSREATRPSRIGPARSRVTWLGPGRMQSFVISCSFRSAKGDCCEENPLD